MSDTPILAAICKNCWYYDDRGRTGPDVGYWALCKHPTSRVGQTPDLLTGKTREDAWYWCDWARQEAFGQQNRCGPEGRHFEPKELEHCPPCPSPS
jgi:hypothetical protein